MFKLMIKVADFIVKCGYINVATEKNHMKQRIEHSLEAITLRLCILLIWNSINLLSKNFFYLGMGFCFYDFLHDGFRMKYFIYKLGDSKDIDKNVEKKIQRKISYIWLLVIMMICSYCISRNLAEYSSECTLIIIICIIFSMVQMMGIETYLNKYIFK